MDIVLDYRIEGEVGVFKGEGWLGNDNAPYVPGRINGT